MSGNYVPTLYIISCILKSGAEIYRHENGSLGLQNADKVHEDVLNAAKPIFEKIDQYYKSVEGMKQSDQTIWKMMFYFQGWFKNELIEKFFQADETAVLLFVDYQSKLALNGWKDIYVDYRQFETAESDELKKLVIKQVAEFGKGAK